MWKLTVIQKKKFEYEHEGKNLSLDAENKVEFKAEILSDLLVMVQDAEKLYPSGTKYEIERVDE